MDLCQTDVIGSTDGVQMIHTEFPDTFEWFRVGQAFSPLASVSQEGVW